MKTNRLIASALVAAGLIFSAGAQAGGLAGGLGGGVGGALGGGFGSGMGTLGGGMRGADMNGGFGATAMGNGALNASSTGLGRVKQDVGHSKQLAGQDVGQGKQVAARDVGNSASTAKRDGGVAGESATSVAGSAAATAAGKAGTLTSGSQGDVTAAIQHAGVTNNALAVAGSGATNATASRAMATGDGAKSSSTSEPASRPAVPTQTNSQAAGGLTASKSGLGADAADQSAFSHGSSSANQTSSVGTSVSR